MTKANAKIQEAPIRKLFFSYLIPAILGILLLTVFSLARASAPMVWLRSILQFRSFHYLSLFHSGLALVEQRSILYH
ncbi:hypothetical protein J2S08_004002 [Bacillus chungangensis]|uniref:Sugar ABC transporter permease n=1 Tax=Bacillus chungangensis TaxID=587633 RepID=A0ABT9WXT8_9BACI|nr:hypothetical protein [Bacillus chungangensis]